MDWRSLKKGKLGIALIAFLVLLSVVAWDLGIFAEKPAIPKPVPLEDIPIDKAAFTEYVVAKLRAKITKFPVSAKTPLLVRIRVNASNNEYPLTQLYTACSSKSPACRQDLEHFVRAVAEGTNMAASVPISNDSPDAFKNVAVGVSIDVGNGDYKSVEDAVRLYALNKERFDDGSWKLAAVRQGIAIAVGPKREEAYERIAEWNKQVSDSIGAALYEFYYWESYAWEARGSGPSSSVTEMGWQLYRERLSHAQAALEKSRRYAEANPEWHAAYLRYALESGMPMQDRLNLLSDAIKLEPYYYDTYYAMLYGLTPRWGGNFDAIEEFADMAVRQTSAQDANAMYARIYWYLAGIEGTQSDLFRDTKVSWPKMRQGFEDLRSRYPQSKWLLNIYAMFSCQAQDKERFLALRVAIQEKPIPSAWPTNYSYDVCTKMYSQGS